MSERQNTGLIAGPDGGLRCAWPAAAPDYLHYHDHEWGRPVTRRQSACSKRSASKVSVRPLLADDFSEAGEFSEGFCRLRHRKSGAVFGEKDVARLLAERRHRPPSRQNRIDHQQCQRAHELADGVRLAGPLFLAPCAAARRRPSGSTGRGRCRQPEDAGSTLISKDLKKRGWSLFGPTTVYAFMQAMGLVNDHIEGCWCRPEVELERRKFKRP